MIASARTVVARGVLLAAWLPLAADAQELGSPDEGAQVQSVSATPRERLRRLQVFRPDFYESYRPQTALDMVLNTPGFQLALAAQGRGLAGNVLINGVRPPAKAAPITQVLAAIPAREVQAILLIPPGSLDVDMAGHPMLLYLVRLSKPGVERSVTMAATDAGGSGSTRSQAADVRVSRGRQVGTANLQRTVGRTRTQGGLVMPLIGQDTARRAGGAETEMDNTQMSTMAQWDLQSGAHLQARVNLSRTNSDSRPLTLDDDATLYSTSTSSLRSGDVATELRLPLATGRELALTMLRSVRESASRASIRSVSQQSASRSRTSSGETALRGTLRWKLGHQWRLEWGGDYASNTQDGIFGYSVDGVEIAVPGAASRVEEQRSGTFVGVNWLPDPRWTVETGLRWEISELHNRAAQAQSARFDDLLPRVAATWIPRPGMRLQGSAERKVGQLAFSQFLAGVTLTDEIITAGAQALQPERSWTYALDYEQRFGERGLLTAGVERERVDNHIDAIVLGDGVQVSANVGAATVDTVHLEFTAPLDRAGIPGGLLTASRRESFSRTLDPVTGERREVSSTPSSSSLSLRQDLSQGAWGASLAGPVDSIGYGVRQVTHLQRDASASVFGEWRPSPSLALRLSYSTGGSMRTNTWLYSAPRVAGQGADLDYLAATWTPPAWQARLEWTPTPMARIEFGASTGGTSRLAGTTVLPDGSRTVERLALPGWPTLSMQAELRW